MRRTVHWHRERRASSPAMFQNEVGNAVTSWPEPVKLIYLARAR
jgi:hypothetical protein